MVDTVNPYDAPGMAEDAANPYDDPSMIEGATPPVAQSGSIMAGIKSVPSSLVNMAGQAEGYGARVANAAGAPGLGDWLHEQSQTALTSAQKSQDAGNTLPADANLASRAAYGTAQGLGQMAVVGGTGAAAGALAGFAVGGPVGALAGGALGWAISNVGALPAMMGLSQAGQTAEKTAAYRKSQGDTDEQANSAALQAGGLSGAAVAGGAAIAGTLGPLGKALGPVAEIVGKAPIGSVVESALNITAKDIAVGTAKAGIVGGAIGAGQTAASEQVEKQYAGGEGPSLSSVAESGIVGAATTALSHAPAESIRASKTKSNFGVLSDPTADINDRQKAAAAAVALISTRDKQLAEDFGIYSAVQIAKGQPIELAGDHVYQAYAQDAKDQAARYQAGQAAPNTNTNQFTPGQGDQTFGPAPTDNSQPTYSPGAAGSDASMRGQDINRPMPSDPNALRQAIIDQAPPAVEPAIDPNNVPGSIDALAQASALDENFLDNAVEAARQTLHAPAAQAVADTAQNPGFTGVPTPAVAEAVPSPEALQADQAFYAQQRDQAGADLRTQAFDQTQQLNTPPAVPEDAFAQRQAAMAAEAQSMRDQGHTAGVFDQAMNAPDRIATPAPAVARDQAVARAAGTGEKTPSLSFAMNAELNRLAQRNPANLTTTQLGTLALHHPEQSVRDAAEQVLSTRKNKQIVQDMAAAPENVSAVQQTGEMEGNQPRMRGPGSETPDAGVEFSPQRTGNQPATPLEAPLGDQTTPEPAVARPVAPEIAPLKESLDAEARAKGQDAAGDFEHVTRDSLPDEATPANNGVEGATTLSKSDADLLNKQAEIFGKKVVLFRQNNARPGEALDGAVLTNDSKTIYVNADASGAHHSVVLGHELAHQMQADAPDLYRALSKAVMKQAESGALKDFAKYYGEPGDMKDPATRSRVTSEFVSDLVGNRFPELNTWRQVFAGAEKENRGLVYRIANFVTSFIDKLLGNAKFKQFATDDMVKNLTDVRSNVRRALTDYANRQGMERIAHEAEQLKAAKANRDAGLTPAAKLVEPVKAEPRADVGKPAETAAPAPVKPREPEPTQGTKPVEPMNGPRRVQPSPERVEPVAAKPAEPVKAEEPAHPYAGMTENQFIEKINPDGKRLTDADRPTVYQADIEGMMPKDATRLYRDAITTPDGDRVQFFRTKEGSVYAQVDGKEVGFASALDKGSDLTVAQEYQGQGIGSKLSELYRQTNPLAESGGLTAGGEAAARAAFRATKGKLNESAKAVEEQKVATSATANPLSSNPEVRKSGQRASYLGKLDASQEAAIKNVSGILDPKESYKSVMTRTAKDFSKKWQQGIADQFAPIRELDQHAYMLSRLSKGSDGALEAAILYGAPVIRDGAYDVDVNGKGFGKIMSSLDGEHNRFLLWEAAHRAEDLKKPTAEFPKGRENLFTDADISALKSLDQSDTGHPNRAQKFATAQKEYRAFNEQILKVAKDSGILSDEDYKLFRDQPYVPFYRVMEGGADQGMVGPGGKQSGLVNQYAFKKLKGGTSKLNDDLLANVLTNYGHLLGAAARNRAAQATMDAAINAKIATKLTPHDVYKRGSEKGLVKVRENGKEVHYEVTDPHILSAVSAMSLQVPGWMKPLSTFKHLLTHAVTVMPGFKVRNLIRDSISALAVGDLSPNIAKNIAQGIAGTRHNSQTYASMLASGGIIRMGSMVDGNEAQRTHKLIMNGVDPKTILDKKGTDVLFASARKLYDTYQELGDKSENINRAALYQQLLAKGSTHAEAAFMSRDMMDFSMQGNWPVVRFLTQSVPFMNARIQGLYKLGKASAEHPVRVAAVVGATMLASVALTAMYQNDPDFQAREDWDRDNYWWFKIGGTAYRIPKPFEVGAAGTVAERSYELMTNKEETLGRYGAQVANLIGQQFSLNPTPQIVKPLTDVYANKDGFTGRPIENEAMAGLQPEDRYSASTSMTARFLGQLGLPNPLELIQGRYSKLSPVQMDALLHGYFGSLGNLGLGMTDMIVRPATGQPSSPSWTPAQLTGGMVDTLDSPNSKYVTQMYNNLNNIEEAYNSYRTYQKTGQHDKAQEEKQDNAGLIGSYKMAEAAKRAMSNMSAQEKRIINDGTLSSSEKRTRLNALAVRKNALAKRVALNELDRTQAQ